MDGRVRGYSRPFARNSRAAELAAAVSATPVGKGVTTPTSTSVPSATVTSANAGADVKPNVPLPPRANTPSTSTTATAPPVVAQEYSVRVPKTNIKPISIMRFNGALGVDPSKWTGLKMAREDNSKTHKTPVIQEDDNLPKFGAGSEYGREAREEAKRRKYGGANRKKYNVEEQPWIMKASDKGNRKYRGVKEGGVSENASYYIFTQALDGAFEVFPVNHWYNFTPIQRYKSLTAEEAEEQFGRRNKIYNYFSVMVRKRLKADDDNDEESEKLPTGKSSKKASSGLKVSEMEDWEDSDNEESDDESDKEGSEKKPKKKKATKAKKKKKGSDEEAEEDSDDGDEEGRELDYISDTSETESEGEKEKKNAEVGVDQEEGLKNLLDSDSDEEENQVKEEVSDEDEDEEGGEKKGDANAKKAEDSKDKKKPKKKAKAAAKSDASAQENLSDDDDDCDKIVDELDTAIETAKLESGSSGNNSGNSRDGTPDVDGAPGSKRKATSDLISGVTSASKKAKIELSPALVQSAASEGITEEAVRRYLLRKPITVTELLQKFKSKKTKIPSQDMVNVIAHLLKKINPVKKTQNQKMYLYLNNKS